jgi:Family of unknown function (DUF5681)
MTVSRNDPHTDPPFQLHRSTDMHDVGYKKPPQHSQFLKGKSGNPRGRPKVQVGISIRELLDGDQRGKNGEVISRREAYVIALVNEALRGNQKAFSKFMKLMHRSGLMRREKSTHPTVIHVPMRSGTMEDFMRDFGRPSGGPSKTRKEDM